MLFHTNHDPQNKALEAIRMAHKVNFIGIFSLTQTEPNQQASKEQIHHSYPYFHTFSKTKYLSSLPILPLLEGEGVSEKFSKQTHQPKNFIICTISSIFSFSDSKLRNKIELSTNNYKICLDFLRH